MHTEMTSGSIRIHIDRTSLRRVIHFASLQREEEKTVFFSNNELREFLQKRQWNLSWFGSNTTPTCSQSSYVVKHLLIQNDLDTNLSFLCTADTLKINKLLETIIVFLFLPWLLMESRSTKIFSIRWNYHKGWIKRSCLNDFLK